MLNYRFGSVSGRSTPCPQTAVIGQLPLFDWLPRISRQRQSAIIVGRPLRGASVAVAAHPVRCPPYPGPQVYQECSSNRFRAP